MSEKSFDDLKTEAASLNIKYNANITQEGLAAKIESFYKASEAESKVTVVEPPEGSEEETKAIDTSNLQVYIQEQKRKAEKTKIVTIIDNDSRVNNQTTSCTVSSSNNYFDLGTVILPLNERVEVRQGHLNVLSELKIPQHIKNPKDPAISVMVMRPRYTIQYESDQTA